MSEQGPGYVLLYEELWRPGIGLVSDLLAIARHGKTGEEEHRIGALMLIASLSAFTREEPISRAFLGWNRFDAPRRQRVTITARRLLAGLIAT
jgi:hypothetical protein